MLRQQYAQAMMQSQGQPPLVPVQVPPAPSKPPPPIPSSTSPSGQKKTLQNTKLTSKVPGSASRQSPDEENEKQNLIEEIEFEIPELEFP